MAERLKKHRTVICCIISVMLAVLVDILIFQGILEGKAAMAGITSKRKLAALLALVNMGIAAFCAAYDWFVARKNRFAGTAVLALLTPAAGVILLETVAGKFRKMTAGMKAVNFLIAYILFILFLLFFQRIRTAMLLFAVLITVYAAMQHYIFIFRGRPFMLNDISSISTAMHVAGGYSYALSFMDGIYLLLSVGWLFLISVTADKKISRYRIARKIVVVIVFTGVFLLFSNRSFAGQFPEMKVTKLRVDKHYWEKGQLFSLLSQLQYLSVEKPENYSVEEVRQIAEEYRQEYDAEAEGDEVTQPLNLILIMNESWADFGLFNDYQTGEEVTPFLNSLTENATRGYLLSTVFGGGTAEMEYEVLTGNNNHLLEENPPVAYQAYVRKNEYGVASTLKSQGYGTLVMHPYNAANYNRKQVYPRMQFDKFISIGNWDKKYRVKERKYVSDQACYDYLEKIYDEKADGEKLFTFLVTMQNHGGYTIKKYKSEMQLDYEQSYPQAEQYLTLLKHSDEAFESLIRHFEEEPEPTMIVMFGDHWPNIQDGFYDMLEAGGTAEENLSADDAKHLTPFIMWTNYDRAGESGVRMSMNYLGSYMLQQAGVGLTDYNKFILEAMDQMPVLGEDYVITGDGDRIEKQNLPQDLSELLNEYKILQYNNMFGGSKKQEAVFCLD